MIEPIKNSVLFAFEDKVVNGRFVETSESGIYLGKDHQRDANAPRWGRVFAVGPDVSDISPGDRVLIENTQWTFGLEHEGITVWRTTSDKVLCLG